MLTSTFISFIDPTLLIRKLAYYEPWWEFLVLNCGSDKWMVAIVLRLIDPSTAAITIQRHYRGFRARLLRVGDLHVSYAIYLDKSFLLGADLAELEYAVNQLRHV